MCSLQSPLLKHGHVENLPLIYLLGGMQLQTVQWRPIATLIKQISTFFLQTVVCHLKRNNPSLKTIISRYRRRCFVIRR